MRLKKLIFGMETKNMTIFCEHLLPKENSFSLDIYIVMKFWNLIDNMFKDEIFHFLFTFNEELLITRRDSEK